MDVLLGKRFLNGSSAQQGGGYQKYGPDRSGNPKSDVELSSRGVRRTRGDMAGYEDGMRTLDTKDSQETILRQGQDPPESGAVDPFKGGGIVRTDVFTVKYENDSDGR